MMSLTTCFRPEAIPCGKAHYSPAESVMLSLQSKRTFFFDVRNRTGRHSSTPQAHGLGSTFADGKMISKESPWSLWGIFIASDTEGFMWRMAIIVHTQMNSAGRTRKSP